MPVVCEIFCTFAEKKRYADGEDNGETANPCRVGEVRCVVLVEWYCALRQEGHGGLHRRGHGHLSLVCRRRALHLVAEGDADELLYV